MLEIVTPDRKKQLDDLINKQKELSSKMNARKKEANSQFAKWLKEATSNLDENKSVLEPSGLVAHLPLDDFTDNKTVDLVRETNSCQLQGNAKIVGQAKFGGGIKIEGNGFLEVKNFGNLEHKNPLVMEPVKI